MQSKFFTEENRVQSTKMINRLIIISCSKVKLIALGLWKPYSGILSK